MTTRITESNITPGSITANSIAAGISLGGGGGVKIDQIIVTDENFANTEDTQIFSTGGYLKIYGSGFQANANVYFSNTFALTTQVTANVVSSNEVRLTISTTPVETYNLFLINTNGSIATKLSAFTSIVPPPTAAWFAGGVTPTRLSTVDRITFATDTNTASVRGPLSGSNQDLTATGNDNFGWFGGGFVGGYTPVISKVDRITFSTDTATASVRGPLSVSKYSLAATGNDNFGWFGGGRTPDFSSVDRITFSTDTATASLRGPLSSARYSLAATGNDNFGWFAGGSVSTRIDRIAFSIDTATASVRGPLSAIAYRLAATSNEDYGWFGGGGVLGSRVNRITFTDDTNTALVRGPLSLSRQRLTAAGNDNFGWFGGGTPGFRSTVDRIDFADDTGIASVRGPLSSARYDLAATSGIA